jgi:tetratricopeptide (TPR) repeat protein
MIYLKQQKFDDAKIYMERKIKLASYMKAISPCVYAIMHYKLGFVFEAQGELNYAVNYYQKSLDIYDNLVLVHYRLAAVLAKQGNFEMAVPHLRRAVEIAKSEKNDRLAREISRLLGLLEEKAKNPSDKKPIPWSVLDSSYQEQYNW